MRITIPATKANFLKTRQTLSLTEEGHRLLDEKRKILMAELTSIMYDVAEIQENFEKTLKEAYTALDMAIISAGKRRIESLSSAVNIEAGLSISRKRTMGVSIPVIEMNVSESVPYFGSAGVNLRVDEAVRLFKEVLNLLSRLAEKKIALIRIAREIQKTIRKVNALEKIHIPSYRETLKFISDSLDEESREGFTMLKLIKERLGK